MGVKIDAVQARAHAMLNVAQREKDKRAQAKKAAKTEAASDEDAAHEDAVHEDIVQPIKAVGGLIDRSA
jgi:hypothetical protein